MNNKILYTLLITIFFVMQCYAQEYSIDDIGNYAENILNLQASPRNQAKATIPVKKKVESVKSIGRNNKTYLYIANAADSCGWVILANEKSYSSAVIAFSETGSFSEDDMSPAESAFLQEHMDAIDSVRLQSANRSAALTITEILYQTPVLLDGFRWKQSSNNDNTGENCDKVYNKYCPKRPTWDQNETCGRYLVGCGAVAMGLIMRYWHWPDNALVGETKEYYDWNNMPLSITNNTSMYQVDAVASLLRQCGIATGSAYTGSGTSATIHQIVPALQNIFSYSASYFTANKWADIVTKLTAELDTERPVLCQAFNSDVEGHTFVIDGYEKVIMSNGNEDFFFHINWGWSKPNDAYYNINFDDFCHTRTFVTELYPTCSKRDNDITIYSNIQILENNVLNHYSGGNIIVGGNNHSVIANSGGHLILEAGKSIHLLPGFQAKAGSEARLAIRSWCKDLSGYKAKQRDSVTDNEEYSEDNSVVILTEHYEKHKYVVKYFVYDISGHLMFWVTGDNLDISVLPKGFYAIQTLWDDGSISVEKVVTIQ